MSQAMNVTERIDPEALCLISQLPSQTPLFVGVEKEKSRSHATKSVRNVRMLVCLSIIFLGSLVFTITIILNWKTILEKALHRSNTELKTLQLSCPANVHKAINEDAASFDSVYADFSEHLNTTEFLNSFRQSEFDGWGRTYEVVKAGLSEWKSRMYADNLKDGDYIFESAMGVGLNTLLTLESIQEVRQPKDIKVFGVEYIEESVARANELLPVLLPRVNASVGTICQGDSSDLRSFVPEESMDLVFCGYISTLLNPLNFDSGNATKLDNIYDYICSAQDTDWEANKLAEIAQEKQNDWFGKWVSEMVRIAKPGAAVIVEEVSLPFCEDPDDWGGVARQFWKDAIEKYSWDIDPLSLEIETDKVFGQRYNVFMRKKNRLKAD